MVMEQQTAQNQIHQGKTRSALVIIRNNHSIEQSLQEENKTGTVAPGDRYLHICECVTCFPVDSTP